MLIPTLGSTVRLAALLTPAFIVLVLHTLIMGLWQKSAVRRARRRADSALALGRLDAVRRAAAEAAETRRDWPGVDLRAVSGALEITRRRLERDTRRADRA